MVQATTATMMSLAVADHAPESNTVITLELESSKSLSDIFGIIMQECLNHAEHHERSQSSAPVKTPTRT